MMMGILSRKNFLHRSLIELPNGDLLLTAYGWFQGDEHAFTYRSSMKRFRTILLRSSDGAETGPLCPPCRGSNVGRRVT